MSVQGGLHSCWQFTDVIKDRRNVKRHLCIHLSNHFFQYCIGSTLFSRSNSLGSLSSASREAYHSLVSVLGRLHSCRQCSYATKNKAFMQRHLFKHTGERPFQCHVCPAAFAQKANLERHIHVSIPL
ncbi:zinc finger protein ZFPM1-like isoform X1 [Rhipicephalus microplus]|uniref:zinc finger protein ZFPM1-like isoform X1 n=1 Tax=Rhipicephalus microplus TaxID=6941 RepID=UPI003F6C92AE